MANRRETIQMRCLTIIVLLLIVTGIAPSCLGARDRSSEEKGFYMYNESSIKKLLYEKGYKDTVVRHVTRNSDGTKLRVFDSGNRVFVFSCEGTIKAIKVPGPDSWLDDNDQIVAWLDYARDRIIYRSGFSETPPLWFDSVDPSGKYFAKGGTKVIPGEKPAIEESAIRIFSVERPDVPLIVLDGISSSILKLFSKNDALYAFTVTKNDQNVVFVLRKRQDKLVLESRIPVPSPSAQADRFQPLDFSPWSDEAIFVQPFDPPFRSQLYSFNMVTRKMNKMGSLKGWGYYLRCDVLDRCARDVAPEGSKGLKRDH